MPRYLMATALGLAMIPLTAMGAVVGTPHARNIPDEQAGTVAGLFEQELGALQGAIGPKMQLALLGTDDPIVLNFIARGILNIDHESFQHQESGLAALFVAGGKINGQRQNACYIVFNRERAGHVWRNMIEPLANKDDLSPGAAFLMGHEVGHCLDQEERMARLAKGPATLAEAGTLGIHVDAWRRSGGDETVSQQQYLQISKAFFADGAQRQYEERLGDAFGVLWGWKRGFGVGIATALKTQRGYQEAWANHATGPVLNGIEDFHDQAKALDLGELWMLSRGLQVRAGVDKSLMAGGDKANIKPGPRKSEPPETTEVANSPPVATPEAPVERKDTMGRVKFENLRRFGSGMNGGK